MKQLICVREYAHLTVQPTSVTPEAAINISGRPYPNATKSNTQATNAITDHAYIPETAFNWLLEEYGRFKPNGVPLLYSDGLHALRLDHYVGVLATPCGTVIEVLPKTQQSVPDDTAAKNLRALLLEMIRTNMHLPKREMHAADLQLLDYPLSEWLIHQFLQLLNTLVHQGLSFDYSRVAEESHFLRGQLNVARQINQPPGREHLFHIRHDVYLPDRPENRLLKTALTICQQLSLTPQSWKLASELAHYLQLIPPSQQPTQDFKQWHDNKLLIAYQQIRPWCELIIQQMNPTTQLGSQRGISLLFPMHRLFEDYVAQSLRQQFPPWQLKTQLRQQHLCRHNEQNWFQLQPDLCLEKQGQRIILDSKWKLLDKRLNDRSSKYGLSQSDFYQLFAYGHKYLAGIGHLVLIYPAHTHFTKPLPAFSLSETLTLWVVPFDLTQRCLLLPQQLQNLLQPESSARPMTTN